MTDDESVIFEIQVEKKVLEQVFNENKHLKESYEKLSKNEDTVRALKEEIASLKEQCTKQQQINVELNEENFKLRATNKELEHNQRIVQERDKSNDLEHTESKLLKMKLQKAEREKTTITEEFEKEMKILEELLRDKSKLERLENQLETKKQNLELTAEELKKTKKALGKAQTENRDLHEENVKLELQMGALNRKLRMEEERNKSNDLEHVESKLLKLKLQSVENEKQYLLEEFERERKIITKQNKPRMAKFEENLKQLRKWIENEARERRPRDSEEVKMLKDQIHTLENDKVDLIEGFELERKVFQKILRANGNYNLYLP